MNEIIGKKFCKKHDIEYEKRCKICKKEVDRRLYKKNAEKRREEGKIRRE